jgi:hypothetical protein
MNRSGSSRVDEGLERVAEQKIGPERVVDDGVNDHLRAFHDARAYETWSSRCMVIFIATLTIALAAIAILLATKPRGH